MCGLLFALTASGLAQSTHYTVLCHFVNNGKDRGQFGATVTVDKRTVSNPNVQHTESARRILFLNDTSGSMTGSQDFVLKQMSAFLQLANPRDQFALIDFSTTYSIDIGFTDRVQFKNAFDDPALRKKIVPSGHTSFYDAILFAFDFLDKSHPQVGDAIVIFSDAGDNTSRTSLGKVRSKLRTSAARIYFLPPLLGDFYGSRLIDVSEILNSSGGFALGAESYVQVAGTTSDPLPESLSPQVLRRPSFSPEKLKASIKNVLDAIERPDQLEFDLDSPLVSPAKMKVVPTLNDEKTWTLEAHCPAYLHPR